MNIIKFVNEFKKNESDEDKEIFVKEHIVTHYVKYEVKQAVAQAIIDASYWEVTTDKDGKEVKTLHSNSIARHMLTCMSVVKMYTDIENNESMLDGYNLLAECGAIYMILHNINATDLKEFEAVVDMMSSDLYTNEYENHAFIIKQVERFGYLVGNILAPYIENLDIESIRQALSVK